MPLGFPRALYAGVGCLLGCRPRELVFTSGGTESDNLAILGWLGCQRDAGEVLYTAAEHPAVKNACREAAGVQELALEGEGLFQNKEYRRAPAVFEQGLERLGQEYYSDGLVDDAGQKPALADLMLERGDPVSAAKIKRNMLDIRLGLFREEHNCK